MISMLHHLYYVVIMNKDGVIITILLLYFSESSSFIQSLYASIRVSDHSHCILSEEEKERRCGYQTTNRSVLDTLRVGH